MNTSMQIELAKLAELSTGELTERYAELFGEPTRSRNKAHLIRKIAWRMQALAEGDLSERARQRAEELADDADIAAAFGDFDSVWNSLSPREQAQALSRLVNLSGK